jgi:LacI family repressor for deo operon, udp, cdd, tsx, nupC, and nupG
MYIPQPATIKQIAGRLNVAVSTVSRALNDHPRIGLKTKMMVKQLASELNYEPDFKAICFKQKKSYIIGVILPYMKEDFFSEAFCGIETVAAENDYAILFAQSLDNFETEVKAVDAMRRQQIDGLIISLSKETDRYEHLTSLKNYNIPVVYFDRVPKFEANKVFCNIYKGTVDMICWLLLKRYRRIAMINGPDSLLASKERLNGYIEGFSKSKLKVDMQLVETTDLCKNSTLKAMQKLLALKNPPQVVITFNDYVHIDAAQYLHNIKHKDAIELVSFGNLPMTGYTAFPPMASLEQFPFKQGTTAINMMIGLLNNKKTMRKNSEMVEEITPALIVH